MNNDQLNSHQSNNDNVEVNQYNIIFESPYEQPSSSYQNSNQIYSYHAHSITQVSSNQSSSSYIATPEQLQVEKCFLELNMSLEEIKAKLEIFEVFSPQYCDLISVNLCTRIIECNSNIETAINLGIIDLLIYQLNTLPINYINKILCDPLIALLCQSNNEQRDLLKQKGILSWIYRTLQSEDEDIIYCAIYNFQKIIGAFFRNENEGNPNQFREELDKNGTLERILFLFFNNKYKYQQIKYNAAFAIACIFKAVPLPQEFGPQLIENLKYHIKNKNNCNLYYSIISLAFIAESKENHILILKDDFPTDMNNLLNEKWTEKYYPEIFLLLQKIFRFGDNETKDKIKSLIDKNKVNELKQHKNQKILKSIFEYLKLIDPENQHGDFSDQEKEKQKQLTSEILNIGNQEKKEKQKEQNVKEQQQQDQKKEQYEEQRQEQDQDINGK